ncbi:MAG: CotH kinase family protein [Bacteroidales bacterium]
MKRTCNILRISLFFLLLSANRPAFSQEINHWETIVMSDDVWRYLVPTSEPSSEWNTTGFDDSGWLTGKGGIGYGDDDDSTVIASPDTSLYMRIYFNVTDPGVISVAVLHVDYDDGFVAYLNGHEIARANIGTAGVRPAYTDFANSCIEPKLPYGEVPPDFLIQADTVARYLHSGNNVLALQVHNCSPTSSDLSSTTFLSVAITNSNTYFRPVPSWFDITLTTTSLLPIISINTNGQEVPDSPKMMAALKVINHGPGKLNDINDSGTDYDGPIGIEIHGQSSQMFPKKSFSVEIRKTETIDSTASLLDMPSNADWLLIANYSDKTLLRNALTYFYGAKIGGGWQPRFRFCVVYLNGDYNGIYMLTERIKRDSARVNISKLAETDNTGDELTGGYIVKVDKIWDLTPDEYFTTTPGITLPNTMNYTFSYDYPKADRITTAQKDYIKSFLTTAETILNSSGFMDPANGIQKYFDYGSFADYQIMQELSNNVDGYRLSQFFYKMKITHGNKLFAGPLWDFDLAYANANYYDYNYATSGWLYIHNAPDWEHPMHWWTRLMEDPVYVRRFVTRWREIRRGAFRTDSVMHFIDSTTTYMGAEITKNFQKWPIIGTWVWPNYYVGTTYEDDVSFLKSWITERMNWMDYATDLNSDLYNQSFSGDGFVLYPNPVKDKLTIACSTLSTGEIIFEFFDLFGKVIQGYTYKPANSGDQEIFIDMSQFKTGYYLLRIRQGSTPICVRKIIKY